MPHATTHQLVTHDSRQGQQLKDRWNYMQCVTLGGASLLVLYCVHFHLDCHLYHTATNTTTTTTTTTNITSQIPVAIVNKHTFVTLLAYSCSFCTNWENTHTHMPFTLLQFLLQFFTELLHRCISLHILYSVANHI